MRIPVFAWCAPLLLASAAAAFAQQTGDPGAGLRLVEARCLECHGSASAAARKAPTFSAIAAAPSTTARSLGVFLRSPHASMPNLILSPAEQDDVIAYILNLR